MIRVVMGQPRPDTPEPVMWVADPADLREADREYFTAAMRKTEPYAVVEHEPMQTVSEGDAVYLLDHPHTDAQKAQFRAIIDRVSARLHEEHRKETTQALARVARKRKARVAL